MKNFILAPDSFKGTMDANTVCDIWEKAIKTHISDANIRKFPMADGGEGMVDSFLNIIGGEKKYADVTGPMGEKMQAAYGLLPDGTGVIEMAACAGLPLVKGQKDPLHATTYGVGELLSDAASHGIKNIILGLGGSATNDCGIGMAAALGYRFTDSEGNEVEPLAINMKNIAHITAPGSLPGITVTAACDVDNPLCGPDGATYTFGPQKGVTEDMAPSLDADMHHMAEIIEKDLGISTYEIPGAGAAGGLGAAVVAFLKGELKGGIDILLDAAKFDDSLDICDCVFVGEGRMDWQSAHGKAPVGISRRAKAKGVPCYALCGSLGKDFEAVYEEGIYAAFASDQGVTGEIPSPEKCRDDMAALADSVMRLLTNHGL